MTTGLEKAETRFRTVTEELWRNGRGRVLVAVSAGWFLSIGVRLIYPALVPYFRNSLGLDLATAGLLLTVLWSAYALGQIPGGILGDRIGEGNILVVSTALSAIALVLVSTSVTVSILFVGTIGFGFATALYGPTRFTILTDIYSNRAGTAVGITMAIGNTGNVVLPVIAVLIAMNFNWRWSFVIMLPFFVAVTAVLWLVVPSRTSGSTSTADTLSVHTLRQIAAELVRDKIPVVIAIQTLIAFTYQGVVGFYPTYLIDIKGLTPTLATTLFSLYFAVTIVVQVVSGAAIDNVGLRRSIMAFLGLSVISLAALQLAHGVVQLAILTCFLSSLSGVTPITQTFIADSLPDTMKGTGLGTIRTVFLLIGASSPVLLGVLGDYGFLNEGFLLLAAVASVGFVVSVIGFSDAV